MSFERPDHAAVGYQNVSAVAGFKMVVPSFAGIGADYSIQNIKISGDDVWGFGSEALEIIDSEGNSSETYTWLANGMGAEGDGWYDSEQMLATRTFDPGDAVLLNIPAGDFNVQFAGQVTFEGIPALACDAGFAGKGNMTPVKKSIQKYAIAGDNIWGFGSEALEIVDFEGNSTETYTWLANGMGAEGDGWYDSEQMLATREIEAAEGFLLNVPAGDFVVSIPGTND